MSNELALRFASAAVLIPVGLYCVWSGGWPLAIGAAVCAGLMAFEWSRMVVASTAWAIIAGGVLANLMFMADPRWALILLVGLAAAAAVFAGRDVEKGAVLTGVLYTGGLPLALQALRAVPEAGFALAMGVMLFSWASDSSAYFVGRGVGGPLLAPNDSPNKTWSGALGAMVASTAAGFAFAGLIGGPAIIWAFIGLLVSITAQLGDLYESQLKRQYGVKDTSGLVPGHGGVMDRLDGFGTACVLVFVLIRVFPSVPPYLVGG